MREYLKQKVGIGELEVYRVLSSAALQRYSESFSILVLPQATAIDSKRRTLTLPYYEGETFQDAWKISNGGSPMGLDLARDIPLLLQDLAKIDPAHITADEALSGTPKIVFDHQEAADYFDRIATGFRDEGLFTDRDLAKINTLLNLEQTTDMIVSNGDFYPRNFIQRPDGKIILIDWETWNDHSPFFIVDHPENVAAVQYVHMWGNEEWQAAYRAALDERLSFTKESFDKAIIMKALSLARFFGKHKGLMRGQMRIIKSILQ